MPKAERQQLLQPVVRRLSHRVTEWPNERTLEVSQQRRVDRMAALARCELNKPILKRHPPFWSHRAKQPLKPSHRHPKKALQRMAHIGRQRSEELGRSAQLETVTETGIRPPCVRQQCSVCRWIPRSAVALFSAPHRSLSLVPPVALRNDREGFRVKG